MGIKLDSPLFQAFNEATWVERVIDSSETETHINRCHKLVRLYEIKWSKVLDEHDMSDIILRGLRHSRSAKMARLLDINTSKEISNEQS